MPVRNRRYAVRQQVMPGTQTDGLMHPGRRAYANLNVTDIDEDMVRMAAVPSVVQRRWRLARERAAQAARSRNRNVSDHTDVPSFGQMMAARVIGSIRTKVTDPEARAEAVRFVTRKFDPAMPAKVEAYAAQLEIAGLSAADALEEAIAKALDEEAYKHASGLGVVDQSNYGAGTIGGMITGALGPQAPTAGATTNAINAALGPQTWSPSSAPAGAPAATPNWMGAASGILSALTQSAGQIFGQVSQYTAARDERRAAAAQAGREYSAEQLRWESQQRSSERQSQEAQRAAELEAARVAGGGYGGGAYGAGGGLSGTTILLGVLGLAVVGGGVYFLARDK